MNVDTRTVKMGEASYRYFVDIETTNGKTVEIETYGKDEQIALWSHFVVADHATIK